MRIENLYQEQIVNQYNQNNTTTGQENEEKSRTTRKDVFEMSDEVPVLPSESYHDFGQIMKSQMSAETGTEDENDEESMEMQGMPPMPPMPPTEETVTEETDDYVIEAVNSIISNIAETLNVSEGDVFETLKSLELSPDDLLSEDGLASVVNALASVGTTTTDTEEATTTSTEKAQEDTTESTLSATIASLKEFMENALESLKEKLGMTDEEFEEFLNSSNNFKSSAAEYMGGNVENMSDANSMQQFIDSMQNLGVSTE